jgi:hypothetical protein
VLVLLLGLAAAGSARPLRPLLEARIHVFQPACSRSRLSDVQTALTDASRRLQAACGIRLRLGSVHSLPANSPWCILPARAADRSARLKILAQEAKRAEPASLALFLLPSGTDMRYSWALVDQSAARGCDSPQEARFLDRLGSLFFTDLCFSLGPGFDGTPRPGLLVAHEVLHALTQRGHPSGAPRGALMADHIADLGPTLTPDWCACARRSPYVQRAVSPKRAPLRRKHPSGARETP